MGIKGTGLAYAEVAGGVYCGGEDGDTRGGTGEGVVLRPECGIAIGKEGKSDMFAVGGFAGEVEFIVKSHSKERPLIEMNQKSIERVKKFSGYFRF